MLYYFVTRDHRYTIDALLQDWTPKLAPRVRVHCYEEAFGWPKFRPGTFVFTDLDRLTPAQLGIVQHFRDAVVERLPGSRLLNDPRKALGRLEMLQALHREGINDFNAHVFGQGKEQIRLPVFIRGRFDHRGPRSELLHDQGAVRRTGFRAVMSGMPADSIMLIEFCDTVRADGHYRKYSVFRFGDRYIKAHVLFGDRWIVKDNKVVSPSILAEARRFLESAPIPPEIERAFEIAGLQYGRIDFSLRGDRPQIWEINPNPVLIKWRESYAGSGEGVIELKEELAVQLEAAFRAMNSVATRRAPETAVFRLRDILNLG